MSGPTISKDLRSVTFLQELAVGRKPCAVPESPQLDLFGQALAPVKTSVVPASRKVSRASATSGPPSTISSASAALNSSLASRLKTRCATVGSTVYTQTWKERVTPAGLRYWEHTARVPTTSDKEYTGWPTPNLADYNTSRCSDPQEYSTKRLARPNACSQLADTAQALVGWPTPSATKNTKNPEDPKGMKENGVQSSLADAAWLAGWLTPTANEDAAGNPGAKMQAMLGSQAKLAISGPTPDPISAKTASGGVLNPAFSRWLQSFPEAWCQAAILAYRAMQTPRRKPASCA